MKNKQFDTPAFNAKGLALAKELGEDFDEFEAMLHEKYLQDPGSRNWAHDYMLEHLAIAFQFASQAMTARGDLKN